jgi:hypothetical protein
VTHRGTPGLTQAAPPAAYVSHFVKQGLKHATVRRVGSDACAKGATRSSIDASVATAMKIKTLTMAADGRVDRARVNCAALIATAPQPPVPILLRTVFNALAAIALASFFMSAPQKCSLPGAVAVAAQ